MSAKDVVAKAKAAGIKLTTAYVYVIRSHKGKRSGGTGAKPGPRPGGGGGASRSHESAFRKMVLDMGIPRARKLVADVESRLAALIRGP